MTGSLGKEILCTMMKIVAKYSQVLATCTMLHTVPTFHLVLNGQSYFTVGENDTERYYNLLKDVNLVRDGLMV